MILEIFLVVMNPSNVIAKFSICQTFQRSGYELMPSSHSCVFCFLRVKRYETGCGGFKMLTMHGLIQHTQFTLSPHMHILPISSERGGIVIMIHRQQPWSLYSVKCEKFTNRQTDGRQKKCDQQSSLELSAQVS